jgi:DNA-binding XRE family transcriptional regulator
MGGIPARVTRIPTEHPIHNDRGIRMPLRVDFMRSRRADLGLSQQDVAVAAGLTVGTVNRIENCHTDPNFRTVVQLARVLNVSLDKLVWV